MGKIIVVDLESTCWEHKPPEGEVSEIIEIGICVLNTETGRIEHNKGIFVKPTRSKVGEFCTRLTTLTQEMVDEGITFKEACQLLLDEYQTKDHTWASYGAYDLNMFKKQCESFGVEYPFGNDHINVKTLFAEKNKLKKPLGMSGALVKMYIPLEGTHHRGIDDAKNIAKILYTLVKD
jgi:inhibitor of KinA sporulation pathway (predicted exonuclease)